MFARMTTLPVQRDRIDEAIEIYKKSVVPAAKKQKGFRGLCLLRDDAAGKGIAVTFWNSRLDAEANETNLYYQEQLTKFLDLFSGPPIKEGFEVAIHLMTDARERGPARKR